MSDAPDEIEVGASDGELRLWLAKESVRLGELRLAGILNNHQSVMNRLASILTWSTTTAIAAAAWMWQHMSAGPAIAGAFLVFAAGSAIAGLWPATWHHAGFSRSNLSSWQNTSELAYLENLAVSYEESAADNLRTAASSTQWLQRAWVCFGAAGAMAVLTAAFSR